MTKKDMQNYIRAYNERLIIEEEMKLQRAHDERVYGLVPQDVLDERDRTRKEMTEYLYKVHMDYVKEKGNV